MAANSISRNLWDVSLRIMLLVLVGGTHVRGECSFPASWIGTWFQSGSQVVHITSNNISTKGECVQSHVDKFLISESNKNCYRCMVIHSTHANVLQYKETQDCDNSNNFNVCDEIPGDAALNSMFRIDASPITCPFKGSYTFTYNRGYLECKNPVSNIDSCMEDWRLLFRFQACPDVAGTESTEEELVCIANWKEGSTRFLLGKLKHNRANTDEDQYRCFIYEKNKEHDHVGYQIAQSGDATCNGLFSPQEGSRTMKLNKTNPTTAHCQFPAWISHTHHWQTVDGKMLYSFNHKSNSLRVTNNSREELEMKVTCTEEVSRKEKHMMVVTHVTSGCKSGFVCMAFHKRSNSVMEVQSGRFTAHKADACLAPNFERATSEFVTLLTPIPQATECPYLGKYNMLNAKWHQHRHDRNEREICQGFSTLRVGCDKVDTIEFENDCPTEPRIETYECHASWRENNTNYLITSIKGTRNRYCFIYTENDKVLQFSSLQGSCRRDIQPGMTGNMAFNVTSNGHCKQVSHASLPVIIRWMGLAGGIVVAVTLWILLR